MSDDESRRNFLHDLGPVIMERALQAKAKSKEPQPELDKTFQLGRLIAFNEVISIIQQQAEGFNIPLEELRLNGIDPDRDLV